jgi:quinoprotein glucose dehydrogenase
MNKWHSLSSFKIALLLVGVMLANACSRGGKEDRNINDWSNFGHDFSNNKFSALDSINLGNVHKLKKLWQYDEVADNGASVFFNPLIFKGKMIALMPSNKLVALEPASGRLLWEFMPDSSDVSNWTKGITFSEGSGSKPDALLFISGSTLYSINANDGTLNKSFGENGKVDFYEGLSIQPSMRSKIPVSSNAPGVVYQNLFIVGCKVPDELPAIPGDIRAFDINTGKLVWIFHTIPAKGEFGAETWPENARERSGGANCWGGIALDEKRGIAYVPTASPSFDFYGADRVGQNLFANCLLALDAKTGKRIWHFQTTHHDLWDRDNGSPPNLVTVMHNGKSTDAVALVTKLGYVFLFDRDNGNPLFPIKEVPVSTRSDMPGEKPWPTQPFPTKPAPFARQGFKEEYYSNIDSGTKAYIKNQVEQHHYDTGIYDPPSLRGSIVMPAAHGGANWGGASYNPHSGVLFVNSTDLPWFQQLKELKNLSGDNHLQGSELFRTYCSSCHGMDRKGTNYGPSIIHKVDKLSVQFLDNFIKKGAEPMPAFKFLPQVQVDAIVSFIKNKTVKSAAEPGKTVSESASTQPYSFSGYDFFNDAHGIPAVKPPFGTLNAIDLNKGEILWQVPLGEDRKLAKMGIKHSGMYNRGGCIATAGGLVFIAATGDAMFRAFDQSTGRTVWETELPGVGNSIPSTYAVNGKQYVTLAVNPNPSTGYKGGYVTFGID